MANRLLTPAEVLEGMKQDAAQVVAEMPLELVRKIANADVSRGGMGIGAAICVVLIVAAQKRLSSME